MTNVLAFAESIRATGRIFAPLGDAEIAMIDRRDLAAVAAVTLTESEHDGRTYPLTGPEAITYHQVPVRLSTVLGTSVEFAEAPEEAALAAILRAGAPEWLAHGVAEVPRQVTRGLLATTTDAARSGWCYWGDVRDGALRGR